jgi:hypothetical protein
MDKADVIISIKELSTNEIKVVEDYLPIEDGKIIHFFWSEGNFACDCNRALYFDVKDMQCGITDYIIEICSKLDKSIIYTEFEN